MEMMATSDCTALTAIRIAARMATLKGMSILGEGTGFPILKRRPNNRNTTTGIISVPTNPIGSRVKILVSSQVSFQNPRRKEGRISVPYPVAGQLQQDILERRYLRAEAAQ